MTKSPFPYFMNEAEAKVKYDDYQGKADRHYNDDDSFVFSMEELIEASRFCEAYEEQFGHQDAC